MCKYCGGLGERKSKKIVKGFCPNHYSWYQKGFLDLAGKLLKAPPKKNENNTDKVCIVTRCKEPAYTKKFCKKHYSSYRLGYFSARGRRLNKANYTREGRCVVPHCREERHRRGRCAVHYREYLAEPSKEKRDQVYAKEGECLLDDCSSRIFSRGMCRTHYGHFLKRETECETEGCVLEVYSRELCRTHHRHFLKKAKVEKAKKDSFKTLEGMRLVRAKEEEAVRAMEEAERQRALSKAEDVFLGGLGLEKEPELDLIVKKKVRVCLKCRKKFDSKASRICDYCKISTYDATWIH